MACVSGTNIVNDGLVFHFDLENGVKSWKGKPTSNLAVGKFFSGNGNFTTNETIQDELPDGSIGSVRYLNADYVYDVNRTVSIGSYSLIAGETYTLSFYVKNINCTGFSGNLYSPGLGRVIGGIAYPTIYTDRWTRVIKTFTVPNEGVDPVIVSPQAFRDGGNGFFKMSWLQMEQGSVATKYINGIRLSTASIIDVSPTQSTITAANLTYRQDDTPTFDGTDDYIYSEDNDLYSFTNANFTVEAIFKYTNRTGDDNSIVGKRDYGNTQREYNLYVYEPNGFSPKVRFILSSNLTPNWTIVETAAAINKNQWYHVVGTSENGVGKIYINGNISNTNNSFHTQTLNGNSPLTIGNAFNFSVPIQHFYGEIPQVKIYNRALSETEVKQNFEATRTRYGL